MPVTRQEFEGVFPSLVEELVANMKSTGLPQNGLDWYEKNIRYNCMGGKYNRGMSVVDTASILTGTALSQEAFTATATLGWLTELLQAFFLVSDDIMDASITRRGQPCWYRAPGVGMIAINDAFMLESAIYILLKRRFRSHPAYADFIDLFHETTHQTETGQLADLLTAPEDDVDLDKFSMAKFSFIVVWKTAFYSFYLPVALALYYLQLATPGNLKQALDILIPLGEYFQAQDDFLDVYGTPEQIGKVGTDIQDNKCSWVVNTAIARASPEQRAILDENYGRKDKAKEAKVKEIFQQLSIDEVYLEFEEKRVAEIRTLIEKVDESQGLKKEVFESFLKKIYKRSK